MILADRFEVFLCRCAAVVHDLAKGRGPSRTPGMSPIFRARFSRLYGWAFPGDLKALLDVTRGLIQAMK